MTQQVYRASLSLHFSFNIEPCPLHLFPKRNATFLTNNAAPIFPTGMVDLMLALRPVFPLGKEGDSDLIC